MVHPAALAITFGVVLGGAIFALFFLNNNERNRNSQWRYEESPRTNRDPLECIQSHLQSDVCSICLDQIGGDEDCFLECAHRFHTSCIRESLRHSPNCPNCRQTAKILRS